MILDKEFQCQTCQYIMSHPVDACPVCSAQFYWMLTPIDPLDPSRVADFITKMEKAVEGRTTREFLTHGGQLWLPHNFWDHNPDGAILSDLPWIRQVRFLQHGSDPEAQAEPQPSVFETNPGMSLEDFQLTPPKETAPPAAQPLAAAPKTRVETSPAKAAPVTARSPHEKKKKKIKTRPSARVKEPLIPNTVFAPLMVFLFLVLMSFSYLALRYHKNTRTVQTAAVPEVEANER